MLPHHVLFSDYSHLGLHVLRQIGITSDCLLPPNFLSASVHYLLCTDILCGCVGYLRRQQGDNFVRTGWLGMDLVCGLDWVTTFPEIPS